MQRDTKYNCIGVFTFLQAITSTFEEGNERNQSERSIWELQFSQLPQKIGDKSGHSSNENFCQLGNVTGENETAGSVFHA